MTTKGWRYQKLRDLTTKIGSGATPRGGSNSYKPSGISLIRSQNVLDLAFSNEGLAFIDDEQAMDLQNVTVGENDVLLNITGDSVARACKVPKQVLPARVNQHVAIIRPDAAKLDSDFLLYYLQLSKQHLLSISEIGGTRRALTKGMIEDLDVYAPDLTEQESIASVLRSLDDKIDLLHRQNATLEAMAETLFRQWFVESEYDRTVGDLVSVESGYAFKSKDFREMGSYRVLKIKNISNGLVDTTNTDFVDEEVGAKVQEKFKVVAGDILIAMTGAEIGKLGIVPGTNERLLLNQRVGLLRERYSGSGYLAYIQLKSEFGRDYIDNAATGSAQPNISAGAIQRCPFPDVSDAKLKNYSSQLSPVYAKLVFNLGQIRTLQAIRDALLPRLMSGEITIL